MLSAHSAPSSSSAIARYCAASSAVRTPPAGLKPTVLATPMSRITSSIMRAYSGVAFTGTLPVEVLMKSAPALIQISDAFLISASSLSSPVSMITFSVMSPHASLHCLTSSKPTSSLPAIRARYGNTTSTSSAPYATAAFVSATAISMSSLP